MKLPTDYDAFMQTEDERSRRQRQRVRAMILECGRPDVLATFDRNMRDLDTGVLDARSAWHSISGEQRRCLERLKALGGRLERRRRKPGYNIVPRGLALACFRLSTIRNLCARDLLEPIGGALDPEAAFVLTDKARFVLAKGQEPFDDSP